MFRGPFWSHGGRRVAGATLVLVGSVGAGAGAQTLGGDGRATAIDARSGDSRADALVPMTRSAAIDTALARGSRVALARADSVMARALLATAQEFPNPVANLTYTRDEPHYHGIFNFPFDYPWVRNARVQAATANYRSAAFRYALERAEARFEVDTMYTRALAAVAHARVSQHNALDADSLRHLATLRRDAGDASEMDVELASVNAGQQVNLAASDSLAALGALLDLQAIVGLPADHEVVSLADTLAEPDTTLLASTVADPPRQLAGGLGGPRQPTIAAGHSTGTPGSSTVPLQVAAAQATVESEESNLTLAHRNVLAQPIFQAGVEYGDPTQPFLLPTFGFSIPLPLFNRNGGEIAVASATRDRAIAELDVARRQSAAEVAQARRELHIALTRANRDRELLSAAQRVVAGSLTAFAEGATALPSVLEAQRSARDALGQYVDDLAAANMAADAVRLFNLSAPSR